MKNSNIVIELSKPIKPPIFVINFKTYIWGRKATKFAMKMESIAQKHNVYACAIPQIVDIYRISKKTKLPVFSPHLDSLLPGRGTGRILPEAVKQAGAQGVLLNHAENTLPLTMISKTLKRAQEVDLITMVASGSPQEAQSIATLGPQIILVESPKRIGTLQSVGKDREFITQSIQKVKAINPDILVVCGGGVSSPKDIAELIRLGAEGTGASRAIFEAKKPATTLTKMLQIMEIEWKKRQL